MLQKQFENIQKTSLQQEQRENLKGVGMMELIDTSDTDLKRIEAELQKFPLQQDDLRYGIFKTIIDILIDNI